MAIHCIFEPFIKRASFSLKIYEGSYSDYLFWANEMRLTFCVQADLNDDKPGNLKINKLIVTNSSDLGLLN